MSEKKIDLIAQMLAKAESTTPEEAEALMAAAAKMMAKYMIDQATIDERRAKQGKASEKIIEERLSYTGAYRGEMLHMCNMVIRALGTLRGMQATGARNGKEFYFWIIGFESDVQQAKLLIDSLHIQAMVAVRAWWKENKQALSWESSYNQEKARRSFVYGFGSGAGSRIRENRNQVVQEATPGTELVLVSRKERVDEYVQSTYALKSGRVRTATAGGYASADGYRAGREANTGEKSVSQGRGISA